MRGIELENNTLERITQTLIEIIKEMIESGELENVRSISKDTQIDILFGGTRDDRGGTDGFFIVGERLEWEWKFWGIITTIELEDEERFGRGIKYPEPEVIEKMWYREEIIQGVKKSVFTIEQLAQFVATHLFLYLHEL